MYSYRIIIWYLLFFLLAQYCYSQKSLNYQFRYISAADGLSYNGLCFLAQDDKGFIWVTTRNGLQRYDGTRFYYYPSIIVDPAEGVENPPWVYFDRGKKQLAVLGYQKELFEYGRQGSDTVKYSDWDGKPDSLADTYIGANNEIIKLSNNNLYIYDSVQKRYNYYPTYFQEGSPVRGRDSANLQTWLCYNYSYVFLFDESSRRVYSQFYNPIHHPLLEALSPSNGLLRHLMVDSRQNIWVTTWTNEIFRYNIITKKVRRYLLSDIKRKAEGGNPLPTGLLVNCILEDDHQNIWIGTDNVGLLRYNLTNDEFDYCLAKQNNPGGIQYNYTINSMLQDKDGNIWVGTDKGINVFNPYQQNFQIFRQQEDLDKNIPRKPIMSVLQASNGNIYVGTYGGGFSVYDSNLVFKQNISYKDVYKENNAWCMQQKDAQTVMIGCQHGCILEHNIVTGAIKKLFPPELGKSTVRCMEKDAEGNLWLGMHSGKIVKWERKTNRFLSSEPDTFKNKSYVSSIFIDRIGDCWVGTEKGLKKFDFKKRVFTHYWAPGKNNPSAIYGTLCQGIEELNDSLLLIGTLHGGLNIFNKRTQTFSHLGEKEGITAKNVCAIKKDLEGNIWFTTDFGLYKYNFAERKGISISMEPEQVTAPFETTKFYPLQNGQWLTFTNAEVIRFSPNSNTLANDPLKKVEITGLKVFDQYHFIDSLLLINRPLKLSSKENFITIEFSAMAFLNVQEINYYHRLLGVDKDWVNGNGKTVASYTNLPPGEYVFEVKAERPNLVGPTTTLTIIIEPPFWKTNWFIALILFTILFLTYLFIRWRENSIRTIAAEKFKVQQLRAEQYKSKLELEQIINYYSSSLTDKTGVDEVLWDTAKNLIGRIGFVDCMIYLWNEDQTKMIQKAGFGPKGSIEEIQKQPFDVVSGQGVVGYVMATKEPVLIPDTSKDSRYRPDEMVRLSEITVPVIYNNELIGIIDSEHPDKNFFTEQHLQIMSTIATMMANKIKSIEAEQSLEKTTIAMYSMNEQLSKAKLEALQSQMNPHFVFNCINSIDALIHSNDKYNATVYLNKFAKLLRNVLDGSKQDIIAFSKDCETLKLYIELEELRNENKFTSRIEIDSVLLESDYKVPPLIVQPFVENAILHGIKNKPSNDGILTINIKKVEEKIVYTITDNGIGREAAGKIRQNKDSHLGMQMSYDRIRLFNKEETASVVIKDLYNNNLAAGTEVTVNLNIV